MPIIDYHCHLDPQLIVSDHKFKDAYELFLGGDHYKWRQMRSSGIDERLITGDGDRFEKWMAYARTMPLLIGNPLYHWTALELKRYFNIDQPLNEDSAEDIWNRCGELLKDDNFSVRRLIEHSNVELICTTDDPFDTLEHHKKLKEDGFSVKVLPTFRPDKAVDIEKPEFREYIENTGAHTYEELLQKLSERIAYFHENECRLSDHSLSFVPFAEGNAAQIFEKRMNGGELSDRETEIFKTEILSYCAAEYAKLGWAMQMS
ncbi:MAG: glucuronate isomerase [Clostridiales bacterium]|nr:glucuronate isomerase [Clostridiales bacterium]